MIAEALKFLSKQAVESSAPTPIPAASGPREVAYLWHGGEVRLPAPRPPRSHIAGCLDEIMQLANRFGAPAVVWYDETKIVLVIDDDGHRCEKATLALASSDAYAAVVGLRGRIVFNQKAFVKFLRIDLAGCLEPGALLNIVKAVKFESGATTTGVVERKKESLGKTINAAANAIEGDIPDVVVLSVPMFSTMGLRDRFPIRCTVDVDPSEATFRLIPFPDEIELAQQAAMITINQRLADGLADGIPYYYGAP